MKMNRTLTRQIFELNRLQLSSLRTCNRVITSQKLSIIIIRRSNHDQRMNIHPTTIPTFHFQSIPTLQQSYKNDNDPNEQTKLTNLGSMIDYLKEIIPNAMTMTPDMDKLDEHIQLRISPSITPNVPIITGQLKYLTSLKATQLIFKNFILPPATRLHILKLSIDNEGKYGILGVNSQKIVIHWKTCDDSCDHSNGTKSTNKEVKKPIYGIFVFELNQNNDKILVHNVENLEIDSQRDFNDAFGSFAPN